MKTRLSRWNIVLSFLLLAALACNLPGFAASQPTQDTVLLYVTQTLAASPARETPIPTAGIPADTVIPIATLTPGIVHTFFPAEIQTSGALHYDVDSRGTAPQHRAPYGDSYKLNRFERPFTQTVMDYLPDVDILTFRIAADQTWYYVFMDLAGPNAAGGLTADYGLELDFDRDGHGDYLIWVKPPFASTWKTDGVTVFMDTNNDTGGLSPERSDAPFTGNGYDQILIESGRNGLDPDLAWFRIDPRSSTSVQFAFKKSLVGSSFMWGVWADLGLRDSSRFSYNDYFTEEQAGSPETSETTYYPIKAIYAVDNTCREAYGFKATGYEPLLCPVEPVPTQRPGSPPLTCTNPSQYYNQGSCEAAGCRWYVYEPGGGDIPYCTYP